ncbi:MAG: nucleoside hydrolase, partial [Dehalococcoidia bacterium]
MARVRVHLDTDIGGDADDLCALAMLLGSPEVDLVSLTTVIEQDGRRAAMARAALALGGRPDVEVTAGPPTLLDGAAHGFGLQDSRYWTDVPIKAAAHGHDAADVLAASITSGTRVVAIGPLTNLARAEQRHPGVLRAADIVVMGGSVQAPGERLPLWG